MWFPLTKIQQNSPFCQQIKIEIFSANHEHLKYILILVMGRTPFYRTSNKLEHHFSNIERTQTCSYIGDRTKTPYYFWLRTIEDGT